MNWQDQVEFMAAFGLLVLVFGLGALAAYAIHGIRRRLRFLWWKWLFERECREREQKED